MGAMMLSLYSAVRRWASSIVDRLEGGNLKGCYSELKLREKTK